MTREFREDLQVAIWTVVFYGIPVLTLLNGSILLLACLLGVE